MKSGMQFTTTYSYAKGGEGMDTNSIIQAISSVGFPIAMCLLMYYQLNKSAELHKSEIDELKKAIDNNTIAVQQLVK